MNTVPENLTSPVEYEWGVQYYHAGKFRTEWGFNEDPRTSGVIDEDGEIEVGYDYCKVTAVGKRQKSPEEWVIIPA